jgi:hypothetical protein
MKNIFDTWNCSSVTNTRELSHFCGCFNPLRHCRSRAKKIPKILKAGLKVAEAETAKEDKWQVCHIIKIISLIIVTQQLHFRMSVLTELIIKSTS